MQLYRFVGLNLLLCSVCSIALSFGQSAPVAQTGQTKCYDDDGGSIKCKGTGQDGEFQNGLKSSRSRFKDNHDGTVTDRLTNLTWLKNADCFGAQTWPTGLDLANHLANGTCGLADQSRAGEWRMANIVELQSLLDYGNEGFALPTGNPFSNVSAGTYWYRT